jgi:hypothetical protein
MLCCGGVTMTLVFQKILFRMEDAEKMPPHPAMFLTGAMMNKTGPKFPVLVSAGVNSYRAGF